MNKIIKTLEPFKFVALAILIGWLVGGIIIAFSGQNPFVGIIGLIEGGFGSPHAITTTLVRATPIAFSGLAAALAWGSGYPSMGAQGQMVMGALAAAIVVPYIDAPPFVAVTIGMLVGMLAGMLYSLLSAYISEAFEVYLLIGTLMFNYVADYLSSYLTTYVFMDPNASDRLAVQTQHVGDAILPRIFPAYSLHYGFVIIIIVTIFISFLMKKTSFGYKTRMGGLNSNFAKYGGVNSVRTMYMTLMLSGALAGLGGAIEVFGSKYRYIDQMITSPGFSWNGITASLMANNNPIGVLFSSIFLGGLTTGGTAIEFSMNIPAEITTIIQGVITMLVTAKFAFSFKKKAK
ncbi:MAG: ABC transporter permease [Peptostreptococcaceae bacterium]